MKRKADADTAVTKQEETNRKEQAEANAKRAVDTVAKPREQPANKQIISYEVLSKREDANGKFFMELLVSSTASRNEVMALAESLKQQFADQYKIIDIFDARCMGVSW